VIYLIYNNIYENEIKATNNNLYIMNKELGSSDDISASGGIGQVKVEVKKCCLIIFNLEKGRNVEK
jgi:hypothetical protein